MKHFCTSPIKCWHWDGKEMLSFIIVFFNNNLRSSFNFYLNSKCWCYVSRYIFSIIWFIFVDWRIFVMFRHTMFSKVHRLALNIQYASNICNPKFIYFKKLKCIFLKIPKFIHHKSHSQMVNQKGPIEKNQRSFTIKPSTSARASSSREFSARVYVFVYWQTIFKRSY